MELAHRLRDVTKTDAINGYADLKTFIPPKEPDFSRIGLKSLDFFFLHHRLKTKTKHGFSFHDAMKDPVMVKKLTELVQRYKKKEPYDFENHGLLKAQYSVFQLYYGTINQFRPTIAKWVYTILKPTIGILDYSSGWGGRALAAMSMGIPYYGIDANEKLETSYHNMIATYEPHATIKMIFRPSEKVDFSKYKYDLIFTSPPYFMIEVYEKMPKYKTKEEFLEQFFVPVTLSSWKYLMPGGNMALNIPFEMYEAIRPLLPKVKRFLLLPLSNRHPTNAVKTQKLGQNDLERHEIIYIWHKQKN